MAAALCGLFALFLLPRGTAADPPQVTTTECATDCQAGLANWELGWADWKKEYCCKHENIACPATTTSTTTSCSYDCSVGFATWEAGWADAKKEWCCKHENIACPVTTTSCSYDCQVGLASWEAGWADTKKEWCCEHEQLGCTSTTTTLPDCKAGLGGAADSWPQSRRDWCCKNMQVGCPTTTTPPPYACSFAPGADLDSRPLGWSAEEQTWCCQQQHRGCATTAPTTTVPATTTTTYDCTSGASLAERAWSSSKASWCCRSQGRGCPTTSTRTITVTATRTTMTTTVALPHDIMHCDLACLGAPPVVLPHSLGSGNGASLNDVSLKDCLRACVATEGCEGVVFTNKTTGPFKTMCYGRKDVHTSMCQPGGRHFTDLIGGRPWGKCAIFGDPHVISFDRVYGPPITMLDPGEYHLIKSKQLSVQARFGYTQRFPTAASTVGVAVGGPMVKDHTLVVVFVGPESGPKGWKVFWDDKVILEAYPSKMRSEDGVLTATHDAMEPQKYHREGRHTIGGGTGLLPSYLFEFSPDLTIYVLIGPDNCNAVITTRKILGGQDGYCGNFDCNQEDDSLEALKNRGLAQAMPADDSLFKHGAPAPAWVMKKVDAPSLKDCDPVVKAKAVQECQGLPNGEADACIFDACAAHKVEVAREDVAVLTQPHDTSTGACDKACTLKGLTKDCKARVLYGATHGFKGQHGPCQLAHAEVLKQCPVCSACSLEATSCTDPERLLRYLDQFAQQQVDPQPHGFADFASILSAGLGACCLGVAVLLVANRARSMYAVVPRSQGESLAEALAQDLSPRDMPFLE